MLSKTQIRYLKSLSNTLDHKYQTSIYPIWLEENNNKITAYVDNNLLNDVSLDNENNNRNITTIKSVKH